MRVLVGAPLRRPPKHQIVADTLIPMFPSIDSDTANLNHEKTSGLFRDEKFIRPEGLSDFFVFCTSDFTTVSKEVHVRTRRVQLLGLEVPIKYIKICSVLIIYVVTEMTCGLQGAGKTSLLKAILGQSKVNPSKVNPIANIENMLLEADVQEGIAGGLCYCDSAGVNLQVFILVM